MHIDLTNNVGKMAVNTHIIISKEQAISIAMNEWENKWKDENLNVTIDEQDATLDFSMPALIFIIPRFEWIVYVHGFYPSSHYNYNNMHVPKLDAGGLIYIDAFTGEIIDIQQFA